MVAQHFWARGYDQRSKQVLTSCDGSSLHGHIVVPSLVRTVVNPLRAPLYTSVAVTDRAMARLPCPVHFFIHCLLTALSPVHAELECPAAGCDGCWWRGTCRTRADFPSASLRKCEGNGGRWCAARGIEPYVLPDETWRGELSGIADTPSGISSGKAFHCANGASNANAALCFWSCALSFGVLAKKNVSLNAYTYIFTTLQIFPMCR